MWDDRYATEDYAYGKTPNDFLRENLLAIPAAGRVLSLAEGEGRNAVFLAEQGYSVTAVDSSSVGLSKAKKLADERGVSINLIHADLAEFEIGENQWDGIVSIFCPLSSAQRKILHQKIVAGLKPGGVFLVEAYTPDQLKHRTGGGSCIDHMTSAESLRQELAGLHFLHFAEVERNVIEGIYHTGLAAVVQVIALRR